MIKYVFKDKFHEKAVRNFCEQIGVLEVDEQVKESLDDKLPYVSFYRKGEIQPIFTLSADNFESAEVYDPNGWNASYIVPPCFFVEFRFSGNYLACIDENSYMKVKYDFEEKKWVDDDNRPVDIRSYRSVEIGFWPKE